jgi:hypothetical protein
MNHPLKSANLLTIIALLVPLLLSGCADTQWPSWLTGEPDASVVNAPRAVGVPPSQHDTSYPNLATVPSRPTDFSSKADRQEMISIMEEDKEEAQRIKEKLDTLSGVKTQSSTEASSAIFGNEPRDYP